ncbi:MAG: hypothetical protein U9N87_00525 [Planctomycetota bacterium]|nr:hypothetical protein [Planctomycetota bacterium]
MTIKSHIRQLLMRVLPTLLATGLATASLLACDTPVYRYAMYNWKTAPYQVFFFHNPAETTGDDKKVNRLLADLSVSQQPANVQLIEVDTTDRQSIERLPEAVKASWNHCLKKNNAKNNAKKSGGVHVIFSPWGRELFAGRLDLDTLRAMTESPARKQLGELLAQGKLVAVCLKSKNEADNRLLDKTLKDLAEKIADDGASPQVEVARLDVSASDPQEAWFVRNLMLTEPDLKDYAGQAMLFMAYGRGRSMLPYIGKGITADNLASCVSFLTGACSCEVKADSPGIDLLMRCDWEAAADVMATDDGDAPTRDGQLAYHEFDPSQLSNKQTPEDRKPELKVAKDRADEEQQSDTIRSETPAVLEPSPHSSFAARQTWILGGGLAFVVAVVAVGGLFFMRRNAVP